eukprot:SAG25_NODE_125_length_14598_cov_7.819611_10_plen_31_part_00
MAALITTALILLNKNVYMFADVSSGSVLEV